MTLEEFKLREYRTLSKEIKAHLNMLLSRRATANQCTLGFLDALEDKYEKQLAHFKLRIDMLKPRKEGEPTPFLTPAEIALAKMQPIRNYIPNKIVHNKTLCLFHTDSQPSMHLYTNSYYCFSCGAQGDTIALVMKVYNRSFTNAVRFLIGK
jgi:hypothetical protein